jgi:hypothetical protein
MTGTVERVHVAPTSGAPTERVESVLAIAGEGLAAGTIAAGDRVVLASE